MRLFHAQLVDHHLEGDGSYIITADPWANLLIRAESLKFTCVVDQIVASPTLTVVLYGRSDDTTLLEGTKVLLNAIVLSGGNTYTASYSAADQNFPPPRHMWLQTNINGAGGMAHVQIWVCGRGPQLLEPTPAVVPTFASQYAWARMLADEGRLPDRRRQLKAGASLFCPPEQLLPSLKWER